MRRKEWYWSERDAGSSTYLRDYGWDARTGHFRCRKGTSWKWSREARPMSCEGGSSRARIHLELTLLWCRLYRITHYDRFAVVSSLKTPLTSSTTLTPTSIFTEKHVSLSTFAEGDSKRLRRAMREVKSDAEQLAEQGLSISI